MTGTIDMSEIEAMVRSVLSEADGAALDVMEGHAARILDEARKDWPVKSGRSRDGLATVTLFGADVVQVSIVNPVPYVIYIRGNNQGGRHTWNTLIRNPTRKAERGIAEDIERQLAEAIDAS
jgi:hypothetical protein